MLGVGAAHEEGRTWNSVSDSGAETAGILLHRAAAQAALAAVAHRLRRLRRQCGARSVPQGSA